MQAALDCKLHEMIKKTFRSCDLQSNKYSAQLYMQLAARREFMI